MLWQMITHSPFFAQVETSRMIVTYEKFCVVLMFLGCHPCHVTWNRTGIYKCAFAFRNLRWSIAWAGPIRFMCCVSPPPASKLILAPLPSPPSWESHDLLTPRKRHESKGTLSYRGWLLFWTWGEGSLIFYDNLTEQASCKKTAYLIAVI